MNSGKKQNVPKIDTTNLPMVPAASGTQKSSLFCPIINGINRQILSTPFIRSNIASNLEDAPISTTRAALPEMLKETLISDKVCEGTNLTGRKGMSTNPASIRQKKTKMTENEDAFKIRNYQINYFK